MGGSVPGVRLRRWALLPIAGILVAACGGGAGPGASSASPLGAAPAASALPSNGPLSSPAADAGGGTSQGDIPDNAVFLTYRSSSPGFSIQYVEGWQVTTRPDGVVIRDKDSTETVVVVPLPADLPRFVTGTDLPALRAQAGFGLETQNSVTVDSTTALHLRYHLPSPPDPVTGKQVPSTIDRYYLPGPKGLAIISLSTPDGVDNVDAFRQMIESFRWS